MIQLMFLLILFIFSSCAPANVSYQPSSSSISPYKNVYYNEKAANSLAKITHANSALNFLWPVKGKVVNTFGEEVNHIQNKGVNIKVISGENVVAAENGQTIFADTLKGWGKTLILKHADDFYTIYANLGDIITSEGRLVKRGEIVGKISNAGADEHILHFEIRKRYFADNPQSYLKYN
jgi:septal ring factor EnvC (AmiA/AmiB activator)